MFFQRWRRFCRRRRGDTGRGPPAARSFSEHGGGNRRQDPAAAGNKNAFLDPSFRPLPFPVRPSQQEHRKLPRAPHALLQRVMLDPFVLQVQLELLQGLPHEFLEERVIEQSLHLHGGFLRLDGRAAAGYDGFMAKRPGLIAIPDVLGQLLKSHGLESRLLEYTLQQHWPEIVGEHIGHHTWPEAIRHRKLYLIAENSVWLQQLRFLKPELLVKLSSRTGGDAIIDIVLRVGTLPAPEAKASASPQLPPPTPETRATVPDDVQTSIEAAVQPVHDPALQARLRALYEKSASS
jgi:Dna[CI] antecedent, DciA